MASAVSRRANAAAAPVSSGGRQSAGAVSWTETILGLCFRAASQAESRSGSEIGAFSLFQLRTVRSVTPYLRAILAVSEIGVFDFMGLKGAEITIQNRARRDGSEVPNPVRFCRWKRDSFF